MKILTKTKHTFFCLLSFLALTVHGVANANIVAVLVENSAEGFIGEGGSEDRRGTDIGVSDPQINASFGNLNYGSASRFDSASDLDGDTILFMNGNASLGYDSYSVSRTVIDVSFENTSDEAVRPTLQSQVLQAGMGIYLSDCDAENLLNCDSITDPSFGFQDLNDSFTGRGTVFTEFNFSVVAGDQVLYSISGGFRLDIINGQDNVFTQDFSQVDGVLTNFRQSSEVGSQNQLTFDWDVTDFEVLFPVDLGSGETGTVRYITEVITGATGCESSNPCPIAYGAFGDPIGRGGLSPPRPSVERSVPVLLELEASFDNEVLRIATVDSGIVPAPMPVPVPAPIALFLLSIAYIAYSRRLTK